MVPDTVTVLCEEFRHKVIDCFGPFSEFFNQRFCIKVTLPAFQCSSHRVSKEETMPVWKATVLYHTDDISKYVIQWWT